MKNWTKIMLILCCIGLPISMQAQKTDDSKYLAGAVPEVNGKVVFNKQFNIPDMSQKEIYDRVYQWMKARLAINKNNSRVVYTNEDKGQIVGIGEEWIVFKSTALSLDRTEINYQLTVTCQPEQCTFEVEKIRYVYRNGEEKYTAEEWITDKYALNKSKTKLVRGLAKWRRKTVDFVDELAESLAEALSTTPHPALASTTTPENTQTNTTPDQPIVITQQPQRTVIPVTTTTAYQDIAPTQLSTDLIQMGGGRLVIVIGDDQFNMTTMTANAGGSLGKLSGKTVVFCFLTPDQPYEQMEKAGKYTVRFYPSGAQEPSIILECKKLPSQPAVEGQPRMYIGEVEKASVIKS